MRRRGRSESWRSATSRRSSSTGRRSGRRSRRPDVTWRSVTRRWTIARVSWIRPVTRVASRGPIRRGSSLRWPVLRRAILDRCRPGTGSRSHTGRRRSRRRTGSYRRCRPGIWSRSGGRSGCRCRPGWALPQGSGTQVSRSGSDKAGSYKEHKSCPFKSGERCHHE